MYLNPGSQEAIAKGCRCPVLDNGHGEGAYVDKDGVAQFWINVDCPLHGLNASEPEESQEAD
jgi:hypothetical protein